MIEFILQKVHAERFFVRSACTLVEAEALSSILEGG